MPDIVWAHTPHDEIIAVRLSPLFWGDQTIFLVARDNIFASYDAGKNWLRRFIGLPNARVRDVLLSNLFHSDGQAAAITDEGLYFSSDSGRSWHKSTTRGSTAEAAPLFDPANEPRHLGLCGSSDLADTRIMARVGQQLLESADGGASWCDSTIRIEKITTVHLTADHCYCGTGDGEIIVYEWADGWRLSWTLCLQESVAITALLPLDSRQLLAATDGAGLWLAAPGTRPVAHQVPGLMKKRFTSLARLRTPDGHYLYATEWHEGVYRSPQAANHWQRFSDGLTRDEQANEPGFAVAHFKSLACAADADGRTALFLAGFDGLFYRYTPDKKWREHDNVITRDFVVGLALANDRRLGVSLYGGGVHIIDNAEDKLAAAALFKRQRTFAIGAPPSAIAHAHSHSQAIARAGNVALPSPSRKGYAGRSQAMGETRRGDTTQFWVATHDSIKVLGDATLLYETPFCCQKARVEQRGSRLRRKIAPLAKSLLLSLPASARSLLKSKLQRYAKRLNITIGTSAFGSSFAYSPHFDRDKLALLSTWRHGLFKTEDSGKSFVKTGAESGLDNILNCRIFYDIDQVCWLLAISKSQIWLSHNKGADWQPMANLPSESAIITAAHLPGPQNELLIAFEKGLFAVQLDAHMQVVSSRLLLATEYKNSLTEIAVAPDYAASGILLINRSGLGLCRSDKESPAFRAVSDGSLACAPPPGFPDAAHMLAFSPDFAADHTAFAASGSIVYRSTDRGHTWALYVCFRDEQPHSAAG